MTYEESMRNFDAAIEADRKRQQRFQEELIRRDLEQRQQDLPQQQKPKTQPKKP